MVALLNKAYKDGNTFLGLSYLEIFNNLPKEKTTNITIDDIHASINQHLVKENIESATLDADCNYILTDTGHYAAEEYSKSTSLI